MPDAFDPASPADTPVAMTTPCTFAFVASVTVPPIVAVPAPVAGRVIVPAGGVMDISVSNGPVAGCPISHSPEFKVRPVAVVPL